MLTSIPLDEAFELFIGDSTDDYQFVADELYDQSRWSTYTLVTFRDAEGDTYQFMWEAGSTEYQEAENEDPTPVYPVEPVTTIVYRKAKK